METLSRFSQVMGCHVRPMKPTKQHRPAIWECMLGTVYAFNGKEVKYFDYDWEGARAFAGVQNHKDPRVYRKTEHVSYTGSYSEPRMRQLVYWILKDEACITKNS